MPVLKKGFICGLKYSILRGGGRKVSRPRDFYINGEGKLFYDCDANGVDMSGKRRIVAADSNRFTVKVADTSTNSAMVPCQHKFFSSTEFGFVECKYCGETYPIEAQRAGA